MALLVAHDGHLLLRALLWLPTGPALGLRALSRAARGLFADECGLLRFWRGVLRPEETGFGAEPVGYVRDGAVWLHALAEASLIADFVRAARPFAIFGDLRFREATELAELASAMTGSLAHEAAIDGSCCFAGAMSFDRYELTSVARMDVAEVRSNPLRLCWQYAAHDVIRFDVQLLVNAVPGRGITLKWHCNLLGDMLMEERDCLELCVAGAVLAPKRHAEVKPFCLPAMPASATAELPQEVFGPEDPVFCDLLTTGSITCLMSFLVRSMGMEQRVVLAKSVKHELAFDAPCSPMGLRGGGAGGIAGLDFTDAAARGWRLRPAQGAEEVAEEELEANLMVARGGSGAQPGMGDVPARFQ